MPNANKNSNTKLIGKNNNAQERLPPSTTIIRNNVKKESMLSIRSEKAMLNGKIILGR